MFTFSCFAWATNNEELTPFVYAAFLNSLRANLRLGDDSTPPSLVSTPDSLRPMAMASTGSLPPPSPLAQPPAVPDAPLDPLDNIPPLTTTLATTTDDKIEGLRLVADSVAQQRQLASKALIFHPLTIAVVVGLLAVVGQWLYDGTRGSYGIIATTYAGIIMAVLLSVRWASGGYIDLAEDVGTWKWLDKGSTTGKVDDIILTKFGEETIGALVLRGVRSDDGGGNVAASRKKRQNSASSKGVIRAWTVKNRYRRKGIGLGLLEEAIKVCVDRGWSGPAYADDHANSGRVLPSIFNGGFDRREKMARDILERATEQSVGSPISGGGRGGKSKK
jgi:hypothetical protein